MRTHRRLTALTTTALVSLALLTGCGGTTGPDDDTDRVKEWAALSANYNGFIDKVVQSGPTASGLGPDATAEQATKAIGYKFTDGVRLTQWKVAPMTGVRLCLTGERDTYLALDFKPTVAIKRTLGTGNCDYTDGAIVLENTRPAERRAEGIRSSVRADSKVVATSLEEAAALDGGLPEKVDATYLKNAAVKLSPGNKVEAYEKSGKTGYRLCVVNDGKIYAAYTSKDMFVADGSDGSCDFNGKVADSNPVDDGPAKEKTVKGAGLVKQIPSLSKNPLLKLT